MASPVFRVLLALLVLLVNKAPLELQVLQVPGVPLALLVLLAKMDSTVSLAPSVPLVLAVALVMPVLLVPQALLAPLAPLVLPAVVLTSASCLSHLKRRLMMVADTTGPMMLMWSVTVTLRWTPPSRA